MNLSLIFNNYSRAMPAPPLGRVRGDLNAYRSRPDDD